MLVKDIFSSLDAIVILALRDHLLLGQKLNHNWHRLVREGVQLVLVVILTSRNYLVIGTKLNHSPCHLSKERVIGQ